MPTSDACARPRRPRPIGRFRLPVAVAAMALAWGCSLGGHAMRPLRIAATESGGDFEFATEVPIRAVTCLVRDHRRSPGDPASGRVIWAAQCTEGDDCPRSVRYGDRNLKTGIRAERLGPSEPGTCYECALESADGRGLVTFGVTSRGAVEPCRPRVGDL